MGSYSKRWNGPSVFLPSPLPLILTHSSTLTHPHSFPPQKNRYVSPKDTSSSNPENPKPESLIISLGRLLTRPADSPEVERERKEIFTALEAEQINGVPTYVNCFRNNESRNGFRTWTGIMLQGVRLSLVSFLSFGEESLMMESFF